MEHHGSTCPTPRMADVPGSSTAQKSPTHAPSVREVALLQTASQVHAAQRRGKTPAGRIMLSDRSSSPDIEDQPPAKRQRRYHVITADSDDDNNACIPVEHPEQPANPSVSHTM
ncbi:hypothetical protein V6N13_096841 [Hibiscus sabdariffa]